MVQDLSGLKVAVLATNGVEQVELTEPVNFLRNIADVLAGARTRKAA